MPTIKQIGPHRFFFFSEEGNEPPHIHVRTAERSAKFWLEPVVIAYSVGYNSRERSRLQRMVEENADLFLEKWNEYFQS